MTAEKLGEATIAENLHKMEGWVRAEDGNSIWKAFRFKNFVEAFGFMTMVAVEAHAMDHHPEWSNVYDRVTIDLVTHVTGNTITERDVALAKIIDGLA